MVVVIFAMVVVMVLLRQGVEAQKKRNRRKNVSALKKLSVYDALKLKSADNASLVKKKKKMRFERNN